MLNLYAVYGMHSSFLSRHQGVKDTLNIVGFIVAVIIGAWLINSLVFRSFSVSGPSMEPTLYTGDRLIVSRLPITWQYISGEPYVPERGQVIVFKNPHYQPGLQDEYIVKRVIGLPGEKVVVDNGQITVYNNQHPEGFQPDEQYDGPTSPTAGMSEVQVPVGEIFVAGDHRQQGYSLDSRNGLGTVSLEDLIGPVAFRIYPFEVIRTF